MWYIFVKFICMQSQVVNGLCSPHDTWHSLKVSQLSLCQNSIEERIPAMWICVMILLTAFWNPHLEIRSMKQNSSRSKFNQCFHYMFMESKKYLQGMYEKLKMLNLEKGSGKRESTTLCGLSGEIKTKWQRWILVLNRTLPIMRRNVE